MRIKRHLTALLATVMVTSTVALVGVATTAPANAATPTRIVGYGGGSWLTPSSSYKTQPGAVVYGEKWSFDVDVETTTGDSVYGGKTYVQRRLVGQTKWTTVATENGAFLFGSGVALKNASYRVLYSGTAEFAGTSTPAKAVKVQRKIKFKNIGSKRVVLSGKVGPKYRGKVTIFKQSGKKWKKYKAVKTNRKSKFTTPLPAPRKGRFYWKIEIPGSKAFAKSQTGRFYTYSY